MKASRSGTVCKAGIRIAGFFGVVFLLLSAVSSLVCRKDSIRRFGAFLEHPDHYDVWFLGNSVMVNAVLPLELWEKYGISSYNLASNGNTMAVTYWAAMNFLDDAVPKVVVIDINDVQQSYKLSGSSGDVHTAFDCFPLSLTKIAAIEDLMADPDEDYTDDDGRFYRDFRWEYYFKLGKYHSRWSELKEDDWDLSYDAGCGGKPLLGVNGMFDYDLPENPLPMHENGEGFRYLHRLIEALQSRGVQVILVSLPSNPTESKLRLAATAKRIADKYGIPFINFLMMDSVMDYSTDLADIHGHCNLSGALKTTDYLGDYLSSHYELPDRSADPVLIREDGLYSEQRKDRLNFVYRADDFLMLMHDAAFSPAVFIPAGSSLYQSGLSALLLQNIGRKHILESDPSEGWSNAEFPLALLPEACASLEDYLAIFDRKTGTFAEYIGADALAPHSTELGILTFSSGEDGVSLTRVSGEGAETLAQSDSAVLAAAAADSRTGEALFAGVFER